jgi:hypothetical protein
MLTGRYLRWGLFGLVVATVLSTSPASWALDDAPTFADRDDADIEDADRKLGILFNPLAIAYGVYGGEVDFVLGRHFAASVEGAVYDLDGTVSTAFGAGLLFYPRAAFHGLYFEPRVVYARPLDEGLIHFDLHSDVFGFGATAGWQWTWDYGFTVRLGGGGMYYVGGADPTPNAVALSGPQLVMDGSIGWTF